MKTALITGITGQDGSYLAEQSDVHTSFGVPGHTLDVDGSGVKRLLEVVRLAGLAQTTRVYQACTFMAEHDLMLAKREAKAVLQ